MNYRPENEWLGEQVDELKKLAGAGMSATLIGDRLGKSKNSVIGKMHRLGLAKVRARPTLRRRPMSPPPKPKPPQVPKPPAPPPPPPAQMEEPAPPRPRQHRFSRVGIEALFALQESECKWPVGNPGAKDFMFCAARRAEGCPYCKLHAAIAYGRRD